MERMCARTRLCVCVKAWWELGTQRRHMHYNIKHMSTLWPIYKMLNEALVSKYAEFY